MLLKVFDNLFTNMIEAGETGGILDTILGRLATFMEKSMALKKKVKVRHSFLSNSPFLNSCRFAVRHF